jgi:UDPglucose--hexose-1-phosphate uridylyltransferase
MFYTEELEKPDQRKMTLYSMRPIPKGLVAPSPNATPLNPQPEFRWHSLREEWVSYASHRQERTFLPPPEYNPLAPITNPKIPTEMPVGDYDAAVFQNLFPSLSMTAPAQGACEVVVFTQDAHLTLGSLSLKHLELILDIWADRTTRLSKHPEIRYVMPFENRGVEMGVTLHHPHGQIYAYPFVPPVAERELEAQKKYFEKEKIGLLEKLVQDELTDQRRMIYSGQSAVSFVPVCARYPYETWVLPRRRVALLSQLAPLEKSDLARALKTTLLKYDGLWQKPFPYLMVLHQGPVNDAAFEGSHLHFEFYPAYRSKGRLKYLAELGAGMFANDTLPEEKAAELRAVEISLE